MRLGAALPLLSGARAGATPAGMSIGLVCFAPAMQGAVARHFWLNLVLFSGRWHQGKPYSTSDIFVFKEGALRVERNSVRLFGPTGGLVSRIKDCDPKRVEKDQRGTGGEALETRAFNWQVAIVMT